MSWLDTLARCWFNLCVFVNLIICAVVCNILRLFSFVISPTHLQELCLFSSKIAFGLPIHLSPWIALKASPNSEQALKQLGKSLDSSNKRPVFLLANHSSFFDTMLTVHLLGWKTLMKTRTYMKADLFNIPFLSAICKGCGHFPVHFTSAEADKFSADKQKMDAMQPMVDAHLDKGGLLAFFPEGRMNPTPDKLDSFRYGGFQKALACDASIWLMVYVNNSVTWPAKDMVGGGPAKIPYDVACYAPHGAKAKLAELRQELGTEGADVSDVKLLSEDCRLVMQRMYDNAKANKYSSTIKTKRQRPWLELALDVACFLTVPLQLYTLRDRPWDLVEFFAYIAVTVFGIKACKNAFHNIGLRIQTAERATKKRNIRKFRDQSWQLVLHVSMTLFELAIMVETDWVYTYDKVAIFSNDDIHPWIRRLYLAQLAVWFYTAFSHRFIEAHHKDYYMMYAHHVVTILLVTLSFRPRLIIVGFLVLLAHDMSDISIDLLKMFNYLGLDSASGWYGVEVIFTINLISWISIRLYWFPFYMVGTTIFYGALCCTDASGALLHYFDYIRMRACTALLCVLVGMHIWWFFLFLRLAYKLLSKAPTHQVGAEEYEGSSDSDVDRPIVVAKKTD